MGAGSHDQQDQGQDVTAQLRDVERDYPGWHCWHGIVSLLYARRPRTSPPVVVRAATPAGLRAEIEAAEVRRGLRKPSGPTVWAAVTAAQQTRNQG
jgi:hypothetical protein